MRRLGRAAAAAGAVFAAGVGVQTLAAAKDHVAESKPSEIKCDYVAESATAQIRLRSGRDVFRLPPGLPKRFPFDRRKRVEEVPPVATIERRRDAITLLPGPGLFSDFDDGGPVPCSGGDPSVLNTDRVNVRAGKRTTAALLLIDLAYGDFSPGATDEGPGTSEVEFDVRIPGNAGIRGSRGPDALRAAQAGAGTGIDAGADDAVSDDFMFGPETALVLDGAGAADLLDSSGVTRASPPPSFVDGLLLAGGQGDDTLLGGQTGEFFLPGPGRDRTEAGGGSDLVFVSGGAPDRTDCGPGRDLVVGLPRLTKPRFFERCEILEDNLGFDEAGGAERALRVVRKLRH